MDSEECGIAPLLAPSPWVERWAHLLAPGQALLDFACGSGRHSRFFAQRGLRVTAVDRDLAALACLEAVSGVEVRRLDLEGATWPFARETFAGVVVTNYLYRPRFAELLALLAPDGVLIYETFAQGHAALGRPSNPDYLLREGELLERVQGHLRVVAFEQGRIESPRPAVVQRVLVVGPARSLPVGLNFPRETP
ncbi:hypothetical protein BURK2_03891 [Burkholderiales bacterium]|nr:MAG: class I SAM-dependent methyltransferase [Burkholderiales bacterium]CAG1009531.1 hypothetical protein BURK2_03891 [Burkholderiales bacterium]